MLVMVVFFIAFRWIHLSTPLIRLFLLVLILLLMPTLNFLPVWFALSLLRFRLPSRLPMMFILWMVARSEERRVGKECRSRSTPEESREKWGAAGLLAAATVVVCVRARLVRLSGRA